MKLSKGKIKKLYSNKNQTKKVKSKSKKLRKIKRTARNQHNTNIRNISLKNYGGSKNNTKISQLLEYLNSSYHSTMDYFRPKSYRTIFKSFLLRNIIKEKNLNSSHSSNILKKSLETIRSEHEQNIKNINVSFSKDSDNLLKETNKFEDKVLKDVLNTINLLEKKSSEREKYIEENIELEKEKGTKMIKGREKIIDDISLAKNTVGEDIQQIGKDISNQGKKKFRSFTPGLGDGIQENKELINPDLLSYKINRSVEGQRGGKHDHIDVFANVLNYNKVNEVNKDILLSDKKMLLRDFDSQTVLKDEVAKKYLQDFFDISLGSEKRKSKQDKKGHLDIMLRELNECISIANNNDLSINKNKNIFLTYLSSFDNLLELFDYETYNDHKKHKQYNFLLSDYNQRKIYDTTREVLINYPLTHRGGSIIIENLKHIRSLILSKKQYILKRRSIFDKIIKQDTEEIVEAYIDPNYDTFNLLKNGSSMHNIDKLLTNFISSGVRLQHSNENTRLQLQELKKLDGITGSMENYITSINELRNNYTSIVTHFLKICVHFFNEIKDQNNIDQAKREKGFKYHNDLNKEIICDKIVTDIFIPLCGSGLTIEGDINNDFKVNEIDNLNVDVNMIESNANSIHRSFTISSGIYNELNNVDINDNLTTFNLLKLGHISYYNPIIPNPIIDNVETIRKTIPDTYVSSLNNFKNKINLTDFMKELYQTAYPQGEDLDNLLKVINKIENIFNDIVLSHYVFQRFIGDTNPLIINKESEIYNTSMGHINLNEYILLSTSNFNKTLDKLNDDLKDCQLKEQGISKLFENIDVTLFDCDGLLPLINENIDPTLSDNFNYHNNNKDIKAFIKDYTSVKPVLQENFKEKNIVEKLIDMYLYDNDRDMPMTNIYIYKYVTIDLLNKYLLESVDFCKKETIKQLQLEPLPDNQIGPRRPITEDTLKTPNSFIGIAPKALNKVIVLDSDKSYDHYERLLFCHNLVMNQNINGSIMKFENIDLNVFEIKDDDIFIYGSNHDSKLKRASINDKIHNFNDILSHLYYFDFSSDNHIETDINVLIDKIKKLVEKTNLTEEDSKGIIGLFQGKVDSFEQEVQKLVSQDDTKDDDKLDDYLLSVKKKNKITPEQARKIIKIKANHLYIQFIRVNFYKNVNVRDKENLLKTISEESKRIKEDFHDTLKKKTNKEENNSNPLKQINLANLLSNLDTRAVNIDPIKKSFTDLIDEYEKRLKGEKINLDNRIKFSAFEQRRYGSWNKFTKFIRELIEEMPPAEKVSNGIVAYGYYHEGSDNFIITDDMREGDTKDNHDIISKDFTEEILSEIYNLSVRNHYSQSRNNLINEIDETYSNKKGEETKGKAGEVSKYKEKGILFVKTVVLDSIKNELEYTKQQRDIKTIIPFKKTINEKLNQRENDKKILAEEFLRRNPQYEGKTWNELYNLHNKQIQIEKRIEEQRNQEDFLKRQIEDYSVELFFKKLDDLIARKDTLMEISDKNAENANGNDGDDGNNDGDDGNNDGDASVASLPGSDNEGDASVASLPGSGNEGDASVASLPDSDQGIRVNEGDQQPAARTLNNAFKPLLIRMEADKKRAEEELKTDKDEKGPFKKYPGKFGRLLNAVQKGENEDELRKKIDELRKKVDDDFEQRMDTARNNLPPVPPPRAQATQRSRVIPDQEKRTTAKRILGKITRDQENGNVRIIPKRGRHIRSLSHSLSEPIFTPRGKYIESNPDGVKASHQNQAKMRTAKVVPFNSTQGKRGGGIRDNFIFQEGKYGSMEKAMEGKSIREILELPFTLDSKSMLEQDIFMKSLHSWIQFTNGRYILKNNIYEFPETSWNKGETKKIFTQLKSQHPEYENLDFEMIDISMPYKSHGDFKDKGKFIEPLYKYKDQDLIADSYKKIFQSTDVENPKISLKDTNIMDLLLKRDVYYNKINHLINMNMVLNKDITSFEMYGKKETDYIETIVTHTSPNLERNNLKYDSRLTIIKDIFNEIKNKRTSHEQLKLNFNLSVLKNMKIIGYKQTFFNDNLKFEDKPKYDYNNLINVPSSIEVVTLKELMNKLYIDQLLDETKFENMDKTKLNKFIETLILHITKFAIDHNIPFVSNKNKYNDINDFENYIMTEIDSIDLVNYLIINTNTYKSFIDIFKHESSEVGTTNIDKLFNNYMYLNIYDNKIIEEYDTNSDVKENSMVSKVKKSLKKLTNSNAKLRIYDSKNIYNIEPQQLTSSVKYNPFNLKDGGKNIIWDNVYNNSNYNEIVNFIENMKFLHTLDELKKVEKNENKQKGGNKNILDDISKKLEEIYKTSYNSQDKLKKLKDVQGKVEKDENDLQKLQSMSLSLDWIKSPKLFYRMIINKVYGTNKPYNIQKLEDFLDPGELIETDKKFKKKFDDTFICIQVSYVFKALKTIFELFNIQRMKKDGHISLINYQDYTIDNILQVFNNLREKQAYLCESLFTLNIVYGKLKIVLKYPENLSKVRIDYLTKILKLLEFIQKNVFKFKILYLTDSKNQLMNNVVSYTRYGLENNSLLIEKEQNREDERWQSAAYNGDDYSFNSDPSSQVSSLRDDYDELGDDESTKAYYFQKGDNYVKLIRTDDNESWTLLEQRPEDTQQVISNYDDVYDIRIKGAIDKTIQDDNWEGMLSDVNSRLPTIPEGSNESGSSSSLTSSSRGGAIPGKKLLKSILGEGYRKMIKGYRNLFHEPNIFELSVDILRATSATNIDFDNTENLQKTPSKYFKDIRFTEYLGDINVLINLYENAIMKNMKIFNKKLLVQFKSMITEIALFEIQNENKTTPDEDYDDDEESEEGESEEGESEEDDHDCVTNIDSYIGSISSIISDEQNYLAKLEKKKRDKLLAKRLENIENKEQEIQEKNELIMKKQRFMQDSFEEQDKRAEEEIVNRAEEKRIKEEEIEKFNKVMGIETGSSSSMYIDKFSNKEKPIPKNPDMDILYLANKKGVDIEKLDREQKKKLLEFTTKERNFKLKAHGKEELVNQMIEHDKQTIRNAINGKPEPKLPEDIEKTRFTEPETVTPLGAPSSQQVQQTTQPGQQPTTQPGQQLTTQPGQQQAQPAQQQGQPAQQQAQPAQKQGQQVQGLPGEKSIITKINPDGNVTVTTKVLKGEDGKDFIVNADTQFKGQGGINTVINLAKKLNRDTEFVNK
jgi:hypothetical protein